MNIYRFELRSNIKSFFVWTISLLLTVVLFMSMYIVVANDTESFVKLLEGFPESVRNALGMQIEAFTSILGYYSFVMVYITLIMAIQAITIGISLLSKELTYKTADFLLTKPISRSRIITSKIMAGFTFIVWTFTVVALASFIMVSVVKRESINIQTFSLLTLSLLWVQLIFFVIGLVVGAALKKIKTVAPISLGLTFALFMVSAIGDSSDDKLLRYLTPFKYFDLFQIIKTNQYEISFVLMTVIIIAIGTILSYIIYNKKDINVG